MRIQFLHLLSRSWDNLVLWLGTTTLSIVLFSFLIPVVIFVALLIGQWRQGRSSGVSRGKIISGAFFSWQTLAPTLIYLVAWVGLMTYAIARTASEDHTNLLSRIRQLKSEKSEVEVQNKRTIDALQNQQRTKSSEVVRLPTQLDRLVGINGRLSATDRARLGNALFEFSGVLDQMNSLWGRANQEGAKLNREWQGGTIDKTLESHRQELSQIDLSAKELAKSFPQEREKWKYYQEQTSYVFGDNPDNDGPNAIINAVEGYSNYLERWAVIPDKGQRSVLDLLEPEQNEFNALIMRFALWRQGCQQRIEQMKNSI